MFHLWQILLRMKFEAVRGLRGKGKVLLAIIAFGMAASAAVAQDEEVKRSNETEARCKSLRQDIQREIKNLRRHEWAGEYYQGDGLGVNVSVLIAPKSGFLFEWRGCGGLYDRNFGSVTDSNGTLRLSFTFTNEQKGFQGLSREFVSVPWGQRTYLVPVADIVGFCNEVNSRSEPRADMHGAYLLRRGDEKKKVTGDPVVPVSHRSYLLKSPVTAEIIKVSDFTTRPSIVEWKFKETPVTLNAGREVGLLPGMELSVTSPNSVVESVTIKSVSEDQAEGIMTQVGEESEGPKIGWKLSTVPRWREKPAK